MLGVGGWKTIVGVLFGAFATILYQPQMQEHINPEVYFWLMTICSFVGVVFTGLGIAHKVEKGAAQIASAQKSGNSQAGRISTGMLLFMALVSALAVITLSGCSTFGIKLKDSTFCAGVPEGEYSVLCEVTGKIGMTPETVGLGLKAANLAGVDQWYKAEQADKFLVGIKARVERYRSVGATWIDLSQFLLAEYSGLPKKVQGALDIAKDMFEFDGLIAQKTIPDRDWERILYRINDLRKQLVPYLT